MQRTPFVMTFLQSFKLQQNPQVLLMVGLLGQHVCVSDIPIAQRHSMLDTFKSRHLHAHQLFSHSFGQAIKKRNHHISLLL